MFYKLNFNSSIKHWLKILRSDPNLIIAKADKGGQTVVLHKSTHLEKYYKLINDDLCVDIDKDLPPIEINTIKSAI